MLTCSKGLSNQAVPTANCSKEVCFCSKGYVPKVPKTESGLFQEFHFKKYSLSKELSVTNRHYIDDQTFFYGGRTHKRSL